MVAEQSLHHDRNARRYSHRLREFGGAVAAISLTLSALALCTVTPATQAAPAVPVSAGDSIVQGDVQCTIGYVYRVKGHTMAVSAGHCASSDVNAPIEDRDAGVTGRTVSTTYLPNRDESQPPLKDWWLIDFGDTAWSNRIAHTNYEVISYMNASESDWVCHYGVTSAKEVCGIVSKVDNPLITVTQVGLKGDSGGPTYMKISGNIVATVGLWQGHFNSPYPGGYVMSLPAALDYFRSSSTT
ncbi:S1 family peptidase [Mycolicibacterium llatzerense]|uniref:S1 family peptidase n=1 Tax=Mycolicibacterium llatzerense TaxID=280871 RepID=UPI0021B5890C|nr:S1 family peptidase [Mycolicibacterium llatzerense]